MKIYLDSAQTDKWSLPAGCPPIVGVTTNPTLIYQAGLPVTLASYEGLIHAAANHGMAELMLQLPEPDVTVALTWQERLQTLATNERVTLTIKLPCHPDWLGCILAMSEARQATLLTGLSSPVQLLWAQSLGVAYVAPYLGRLVADGRDAWTLIEACIAVQAHGPALLAASIKGPEVLAKLIAKGAAAATLPPENLIAWSRDALTEAAIAQFTRDSASSVSLARP